MNAFAIILGGFGAVGLAKMLSGGGQIRLSGIPYIGDKLTRHAWKVYKKRPIEGINHIIIHHTVSAGQSAEQIAQYQTGPTSHLEVGGAPAIAYHFYIREDGSSYQVNNLDVKTWHVGNMNPYSIGVCLSGNFENAPPTQAQIVAVKNVVNKLKSKFRGIKVMPHKAYRSTSCPGKYFDMNIFN